MGRTGLGPVIRNHQGELLAAMSVTRIGLLDPAAVEALATSMALQLARDRGFLRINLEGDVKMVLEAVMADDPGWSRIGHLVEDVRFALQHFNSWTMAYVKREANQATQKVAKMATAQPLDRTWSSDFPDVLREICASELSALNTC
ncbi:uncharacterized protein LOC132185133 [Corylus avellana]|uniref:uncharacterized protein LOC132185133 n=1 Tax=Corylus avellana TaxID=13451 RepID=UPI00286BB017|nr:uncharacterized protein LOC132185133 [Corylus avellana]